MTILNNGAPFIDGVESLSISVANADICRFSIMISLELIEVKSFLEDSLFIKFSKKSFNEKSQKCSKLKDK